MVARAAVAQAQAEQFGTALPQVTAAAGATPTIDWNTGEIQELTLTANTTIQNPINVPAIAIGTDLYLVLIMGGAGSYTVAWGSAYRNAPAVTTGAAATRCSFLFRYDGAHFQYIGGNATFA